LICYRAAWIVPIAGPPIADGWIAVEAGRIVECGAGVPAASEVRDLGTVAILPGLVNAHTHLELSYLREQVPVSAEFVGWIRHVVGLRRAQPDAYAPVIVDGIAGGIADALACGTAVVGDITNTLQTYEPLRASPLAGVVFYELIRFNAPDPAAVIADADARLAALPAAQRLRAALAAHAPYSVAPAVFREMRRARDRRDEARCSVHLAESRDETEFIAAGTGAWREFLQDVGAWDPAWRPAAATPVEYLDALGFLDDRVLAVHGVQATPADLTRLADRGVTLVTCPRSNARTGAGTPPIEAFYASGVRVAIGTDSLASTPDLNVFAELAAMRLLAPSVAASRLLDSATRQGALALGMETDYGTLERGRRARLLAVAIPDGVGDVEEYLVSGVQPAQIRWIE
jgi:cytosine/adenosine deaminase-related metal-dependent hydrolase